MRRDGRHGAAARAAKLARTQVSIRQHTSAYVTAYVSIRQHTADTEQLLALLNSPEPKRQHTAAYVSIRQHASACVSIREREQLLNSPEHRGAGIWDVC
jgi:hypothetical protein